MSSPYYYEYAVMMSVLKFPAPRTLFGFHFLSENNKRISKISRTFECPFFDSKLDAFQYFSDDILVEGVKIIQLQSWKIH